MHKLLGKCSLKSVYNTQIHVVSAHITQYPAIPFQSGRRYPGKDRSVSMPLYLTPAALSRRMARTYASAACRAAPLPGKPDSAPVYLQVPLPHSRPYPYGTLPLCSRSRHPERTSARRHMRYGARHSPDEMTSI